MPFERFTQTGQRFKPKISIWSKGGQMGLNQGAIVKYNLDNYRYAILFFDREIKRIGIKFTNEENEEGVINFKTRKTGGVIPAKSFLDFFGIDYSETRKYDLIFDEKSKLYIVDLP
jgi:hypothetical protein